MIKKFSFLFLFLITISCTFTVPETLSFDDKVATQAAVAFTATALDLYFKNPTATPQPTAGTEALPTETPAPTPTLNNEDPVKSLGQPNWKDELSNASNWFSSGSFTSEKTKFYPSDGGIVANSAKS